MPAWPRNLKQAVEQHGSPAATGPIVTLVEHAFELDYEEGQKKRLKERGTLDKQTMYVSNLGEECIRKLYFNRSNEPVTNPLTVDSLMNFMVGHAVEESVAKMLGWLGCEVIQEHHIALEHDGTKTTGRVDFLIDVPREVLEKLNLVQDVHGRGLPENMLVELKATSSKAMIAMIVYQEAGKDGHRHQLNGYLHASKEGLLPKEYDTGFLVYVIKDATKGSPNIFAYRHDYDPEMIAGDLGMMAYVEKIVEAGDDPGIPVALEEKAAKNKGKPPVWPCGYCSFETRCWG